MTTHPDPSPPVTENGRKRFKPHQLVIGIGCFMGLFTLVSGILPQITNWHDDKSPSREVFGGIPARCRSRCYTVIPVMVGVGGHRVRRPSSQLGARRSRPSTNDDEERRRRLADFRAGVYMRTLLARLRQPD